MLRIVALLALASLPVMAAGIEPGRYEIVGGDGDGYVSICESCPLEWSTPSGEVVWTGEDGVDSFAGTWFHTEWMMTVEGQQGYSGIVSFFDFSDPRSTSYEVSEGRLTALIWRDWPFSDLGFGLVFDQPNGGTWRSDLYASEIGYGAFILQQVESYLPAPTPEPGTLSLAGAALLALGLARIRSRTLK